MVALVAIQQLPDQHREILVRAIHNVLSSPIAEITYGEIIDGLPLGETATDAYNRSLCPCHPLMQERVELSPGVIEKAQKLHSEFQPALLTADPNVSSQSWAFGLPEHHPDVSRSSMHIRRPHPALERFTRD